MAKEKLEYKVEFPISFKGEKKALKDIEKLEKSFMKFTRNAQAASARINWGALAKSGTLGRTMTNIVTKNLTDFLPHKSFARAGASKGSSFGKKIWGADMAADYAEKYQLNRLAKGKSLTSKTAMTGVNKAAGRGMAAAGAKGAAMGGAAGGLLGGALMLLPALIGIIVASSRMLQKTLGNIMKYLLMFLRPIGDMLAVLFYPLMMILRPLAMMVNTIIRPFLMEARKSFRLSLQLGKQAKTARGLGAMESAEQLDAASKEMMVLGIQTLGVGFGKVIVNMMGELTKLVGGLFIDVMAFQFNNLATVLYAVSLGAIDLRGAFDGAAQEAKRFVETGVDNALLSINNMADEFLKTVTAKNSDMALVVSKTGDFLDTIQGLAGTEGLPVVDSAFADLLKKARELAGTEGFPAVANSMQLVINSLNGDNVKTVIDNVQKALDSLSYSGMGQNGRNSIEKEGNIFTQILGFLGTGSTAVVDGIESIGDFFGLVDKNQEQFDNLYEFSKLLGDGYSVLQANTILAYGGLQTYTEELAKTNLELSTKTNVELPILSTNISALGTKTSSAILAIDSALTACKNAELSAKAAAKQSQESANSISINTGKTSTPLKPRASGGLVSENGMYYLHKGENVTNPVSSSFNHTAGSSNSLPSIEFNNCTFGGTEDWKKKMDEYFNKQMRHIR